MDVNEKIDRLERAIINLQYQLERLLLTERTGPFSPASTNGRLDFFMEVDNVPTDRRESINR